MKMTALWCLIVLNVVLLGTLVSRYVRPNAAMAQVATGRAGDYTVIPLDTIGTPAGSIIVIDNITGKMTAIQTDEANRRMVALQRVDAARMFDNAAGNRRPPTR